MFNNFFANYKMPMTEEEKQKKREYGKDYYERNKERIKKQSKDYREKNKDKIKKQTKDYYQENKEKKKEYDKEYKKTPQGKKVNIISNWKYIGLKETDEKIEELYEIYTTIKFCEACDIELTRTGKNSATDINLDHCHQTGKFRLMLCGTCNRHDGWKKYFC